MIVYRFTDESLVKGVYSSGIMWNAAVDQSACFDAEMHPNPWSDPGLAGDAKTKNLNMMELVCGFGSLDQVFNWFYSEELLGKMADARTWVRTLEVDESVIAFGQKQIMFHENRCRTLFEEPLRVFLERTKEKMS